MTTSKKYSKVLNNIMIVLDLPAGPISNIQETDKEIVVSVDHSTIEPPIFKRTFLRITEPIVTHYSMRLEYLKECSGVYYFEALNESEFVGPCHG